ncbi:hypothetical protein V6Z11_D12G196800 [Gossypium hirsutum]
MSAWAVVVRDSTGSFSMQVDNVVMETYCKRVVDLLTKKQDDDSDIALLIYDCYGTKSSIPKQVGKKIRWLTIWVALLSTNYFMKFLVPEKAIFFRNLFEFP